MLTSISRKIWTFRWSQSTFNTLDDLIRNINGRNSGEGYHNIRRYSSSGWKTLHLTDIDYSQYLTEQDQKKYRFAAPAVGGAEAEGEQCECTETKLCELCDYACCEKAILNEIHCDLRFDCPEHGKRTVYGSYD